MSFFQNKISSKANCEITGNSIFKKNIFILNTFFLNFKTIFKNMPDFLISRIIVLVWHFKSLSKLNMSVIIKSLSCLNKIKWITILLGFQTKSNFYSKNKLIIYIYYLGTTIILILIVSNFRTLIQRFFFHWFSIILFKFVWRCDKINWNDKFNAV